MKIAILNGGGPAPGLNGVIHAATIAAHRRGFEVIGIPKGFEHLIAGNTTEAFPLGTRDVAGIETRGGSILFTSRANPTKKKEDLAVVTKSLRALGVEALVTIGGDDTASAAVAVAEAAGIRVAHVPKTIDNDLPLPGETPTFGFETAKHVGAALCKSLREDARTTGRWYLVTGMGRSAGHLALGMGMGAGADLVLVPEEFPERVPLRTVCDAVQKAIERRAKEGQGWGLVVLAEGLLDRLPKEDLASIASLEKDEHGNPRMSEVDLGRAVRDALVPRLASKVGFVTKIIGYELRCADPIAFDVQYTQTLGAAAIEFLATGSGTALITVRDGKLAPLRLGDLRGPDGRVKVRRVDTASATWHAALALQAR